MTESQYVCIYYAKNVHILGLEHHGVGRDEEQQTSVEELLAFIEGGDGEEVEQTATSKASKRQKKKQKKVLLVLFITMWCEYPHFRLLS